MATPSVLIPDKYEVLDCRADAALDQDCDLRAVALVDGAPLCHDHAREAYDRVYSEICRLPQSA